MNGNFLSIKDFPDGSIQPISDICSCGSKMYIQKKGKHIGLYCKKCGWIKWLKQKVEAFIFPFGKYKGKTLGEIKEIDIEYLRWSADKFNDKPNIANKIKEILEME